MSSSATTTGLAGRGLRLVFLCAGLALLATAVWQTITAVSLLYGAAVAEGVVDAADDPSADRAHPMIAFKTAQGQLIRYRQNGYEARRGHPHVVVLYRPADPAGTAVMKSFATLWLPVLMPTALGTAALGIAVTSFFLDR